MMIDFAETYRTLTDDAVLKLWAERSQLVSEAKVSLITEIQRRSLTREANVIAENTLDEPAIIHEPPPAPRKPVTRLHIALAIGAVVLAFGLCFFNLLSAVIGTVEMTGLNYTRLEPGVARHMFLVHFFAFVLGPVLLPCAAVFVVGACFSRAIPLLGKVLLCGMFIAAGVDWLFLNNFVKHIK